VARAVLHAPETSRRHSEKNGHLPVEAVRDGEILVAVRVQVGNRYVVRMDAPAVLHGGPERPSPFPRRMETLLSCRCDGEILVVVPIQVGNRNGHGPSPRRTARLSGTSRRRSRKDGDII